MESKIKNKSGDLQKVTKKDLQDMLLNANRHLDIFRNGVFNTLVSLKYVKEDTLDIDNDLFTSFTNCINDLENKLSVIVSKLNLKLGDVVKNE